MRRTVKLLSLLLAILTAVSAIPITAVSVTATENTVHLPTITEQESIDSIDSIAPIESSESIVPRDSSEEDTADSRLANGWYRFKSAETGLYLDLMNGGSTAGTAVQQWDCNYTASQLFKITYISTVGSHDLYTIRPMLNPELGLSAPYSGTDRYATVQAMSANDNDEEIGGEQMWKIIPNGTSGQYWLKNGTFYDESYLTTGESTAAGSRVFTTFFNDSCSLWYPELYEEPKLVNGVYGIKSAATGLYADVAGGNGTAGVSLQQWTGNGTASQLFQITYLETTGSYHSYSIRPMLNLSLGVSAPFSGTNRYATIEAMSANDNAAEIGDSQQWTLLQNGVTGQYMLRNGDRFSISYLSTGGATSAGNQLITTETNDANNKWILELNSASLPASGVYRIKNAITGLYLDVRNGGNTAGTPVQLWEGNGTLSQLFKITNLPIDGADNAFSIRSMLNSGLGLYTATTNSVPRTASIEAMRANDTYADTTSNQTWWIIRDGIKDQYLLKNGFPATLSYLNTGGNFNSGNQLVTSATSDIDSRWILEPYTGPEIEGITWRNAPTEVTIGKSVTYQAVAYSSVIGRNGPPIYSVTDTNGNATTLATIDSSTGVLTALDKGTVKVRVTFDGSATFAETTVNLVAYTGTFYLRNYASGNYMTYNASATTGNIQVNELLVDTSLQQWELVYTSAGYYRIKNIETSKYMTASEDVQGGVPVTVERSLSSSAPDRQLWKLVWLSNGTCQIQSKYASGCYPSAYSTTAANGTTVVQYSALHGPHTQWNLYSCSGATEALLVGLIDNSTKSSGTDGLDGGSTGTTGHDHTSEFLKIQDQMFTMGYNGVTPLYSDSIWEATVLNAMESCRVFAYRGHGAASTNEDWIALNVIEDLSSYDLFNFDTSTVVTDLSNCDVALFVACETGAHPTQSLPHAAVAAGAKYAVGFKYKIDCSDANTWTNIFFTNYHAGYSAEFSRDQADKPFENNETMTSKEIIGGTP